MPNANYNANLASNPNSQKIECEQDALHYWSKEKRLDAVCRWCVERKDLTRVCKKYNGGEIQCGARACEECAQAKPKKGIQA